MSTYTRSEITIATKEAVDNTFISKWFQNLSEDQQAGIKNVILSDDKTHVDVCYHPALEMDKLLADLSKKVSYTLVTVGHNYSNMSPFTNPRSQGGPRFQSGEELANSVGKINAYYSL